MESSKDQLKIPIAFIECVGGSLPEKVFLRDRYNNLWTVKVEHNRENWYFRDGWAMFVKDNRVISGDYLVFEYFLVSLFDFKILGPSATETEGVGAFLSKEIKEQRQISEKEVEQAEEENDDDSEGGDCIFKRQKTESKARGSDDDKIKDADYVLISDNECDDEMEQVNKANTIGASYGKQTSSAPKYCGIEIFKSGLAPQPINPYFVVRIMRRRRCNLLPKPEIILVDPRGREFRGKYREWADGRVMYTGGWKALCTMNFVEEHDDCVCEFLQGDRGLYLSVSFVRAHNNGGNRH